jgi:hypothetical protein
MTSELIKFNINQIVRVKLTDHGRKIHRQQFRKFNAQFPNGTFKYDPPKEDEDGWSRWQLWDLIETFGSHVGVCKLLPFETEIELDPST